MDTHLIPVSFQGDTMVLIGKDGKTFLAKHSRLGPLGQTALIYGMSESQEQLKAAPFQLLASQERPCSNGAKPSACVFLMDRPR
ncbi:hypothetical protein [Pseudomonas graminis]|uniref:hypothetical protein n=1 Tax=Pseudomonas graminis TaxID=158627 RepID=UPI003C276934